MLSGRFGGTRRKESGYTLILGITRRRSRHISEPDSISTKQIRSMFRIDDVSSHPTRNAPSSLSSAISKTITACAATISKAATATVPMPCSPPPPTVILHAECARMLPAMKAIACYRFPKQHQRGTHITRPPIERRPGPLAQIDRFVSRHPYPFE